MHPQRKRIISYLKPYKAIIAQEPKRERCKISGINAKKLEKKKYNPFKKKKLKKPKQTNKQTTNSENRYEWLTNFDAVTIQT